MRDFRKEFRTLEYIFGKAHRVLLVCHSRPDPDTIGANMALKLFLEGEGKHVDLTCFDPVPELLDTFPEIALHHPDALDLRSYDVVVAGDSVDRGFDKILERLDDTQATIIIDHHPDIDVTADVMILDPEYSSTCELIFLFFESISAHITKPIATFLFLGLAFDTGAFQHASVTPQVMRIASRLIALGAPAAKISELLFTKKNIAALRLWGRAFEKAKLHPESGFLSTVITHEDVAASGATPDDIYQVTTILSSVPDAKFILVLTEREDGTVRGSFRSLACHGVDVSALAQRFGGGGHKLASGFELPGRVIETEYGWQVA